MKLLIVTLEPGGQVCIWRLKGPVSWVISSLKEASQTLLHLEYNKTHRSPNPHPPL